MRLPKFSAFILAFILNHANGEIKMLNQRNELICGCK